MKNKVHFTFFSPKGFQLLVTLQLSEDVADLITFY